MNTKKITLFFIIMCNPTMLFPLTYNESRLIRKDLYSKYDNNTLTESQLIEENIPLFDVIERDLKILHEHKDKLQQKIDFQKSFTSRHFVPFCNKILAFIYGSASATMGIFTLGTSLAVDNLWNGKNDTRLWWSDRGVKLASWLGVMTPQDVAEYNQNKLRDLVKRYPDINNAIQFMPITAGISIITGILFFKKIYTIIKYHNNLNKNIKKTQARWNRDQAVIIKLKEIKYELKKAF